MATGLTLRSIKSSLGVGNRIDVDGSWLFYHLQKGGERLMEDIVGEMATLLTQIAHCGGFKVTVIMDGDARPDCKRATWERRKNIHLKNINRMYCRFKVLELSSRLENDEMNGEKRQEVQNELCLFNEAAKSLESKAGITALRNNFCNLLLLRLSKRNAFEMNENGGFVTPFIIKAKFQADYVIALRSKQMKNDFIFSADTDFAALLGNECLMITHVKNTGSSFLKKKKNDENNNDKEKKEVMFDASAFEVALSGPSNKKMMELQQRLEGDSVGSKRSSRRCNKKVVWTKAKLPLFEDKPQRLRALIALAMGCDVFHGVKNCGPSTIEKALKLEKEKNGPLSDSALTDAFQSFLEKELKKCVDDDKNTTTQHLMDTLVEAFLCEPGVVTEEVSLQENSNVDDVFDDENNEEEEDRDNDLESISSGSETGDIEVRKGEESEKIGGENQISSHNPYITDDVPSSLSTYVKSFKAHPSIEIKDGASLCFCEGTSYIRGHFYPKFEGSWKCSMCKKDFCGRCSFVPELDNKQIGKKQPKIYYKYGCEHPFCIDCFQYHCLGNDYDESSQNTLSEVEMSKVLNEKFGLQLNDKTASFSETLDLYDAYISSPNNIHDHQMDLVKKKVKFPLFASSLLDSNMDATDSPIFKPGKIFKLKNGGCFISDPSFIKDEEIPEILDLFASFLEVDPTKHVHKSDSDIGQFGYLPNIILNTAYQSRVDSGFRLVKRCVRHTFNTSSPLLIGTEVEIFRLRETGK